MDISLLCKPFGDGTGARFAALVRGLSIAAVPFPEMTRRERSKTRVRKVCTMFKNVSTMILFKALRNDFTVDTLKHSHKNSKLIPNTFIDYIIWNLPAVTTCPGATGHCKGQCYALKAERAYPTCLPSRERNLALSKQGAFVKNMVYTILKRRYYSRKKLLVVRIHESGDFYSCKYAMDWLEIARTIESTGERVRFIAYTKSFSFFDGVELPANFSLRASVWDDTPEEDLEMIERNGWTIYTAVEKFGSSDSFHHCRCEDCSGCLQCLNSQKKVIACEIH